LVCASAVEPADIATMATASARKIPAISILPEQSDFWAPYHGLATL
jgi:hypothetical protein